MNPEYPGNLTPLWAAADQQVDLYIASLRTTKMTTSDVAMMLLAQQDGQNVKLNLAIIAATALQRLANGGV